MKKIVTAFFMAWGMFFSVPCPYRKWDDSLRGGMLLCFPLIGVLIGAIWAAVFWLLARIACPLLLTAVILTACPFLLTGFIHLDGFMDCCDAILSRRDLEERRKILKDSRTGSFAVICIVLLLLTETALFDAADLTGGRQLCLVLIPVVSRMCSALAVFGLEPMSGSSYAGGFRKNLRSWYAPAMLIALIAVMAGMTALAGRLGLCGLLTTAGAALAVLQGDRQLGGMSGDISGYAITIGELCGIASLALL